MPEVVPGIAFVAPLDDADALFAVLRREVAVADEIVADVSVEPTIAPRKTGWYGDPDAVYSYANIERTPARWPPALAALRARLDARLGTRLNSCLVGMYDDGDNTVDWHADCEPELRDRIVSVSLGDARRFSLRKGTDGEPFFIVLAHGSVLVMTVASQHIWQHAILREPGAGPRMNLTFRTIGRRAG